MASAKISKADADLLHCLADPTRRAILERLRKSPASVGDIAENLPVSRPAVSQHLRVLEGAGLVTQQPRGTQRVFRVELKGLAKLRRYMDALWDDALRAFERDSAAADAAAAADAVEAAAANEAVAAGKATPEEAAARKTGAKKGRARTAAATKGAKTRRGEAK